MSGLRLALRSASFALRLLLVSPSAPRAAVWTHAHRYGPFDMGAFTVRYTSAVVRPPERAGYGVGLHARLVDTHGRPVTIRDVMLHHAVFRRIWTPQNPPECTSTTGEAFYSTGEEDRRLMFPRGYGYRVRPDDRWRVTAMLMSHTLSNRRVYLQYRVVTAIRSRLTPVHPFWLRAIGCSAATSYPVAGGGPPGATDVRGFDWRVPYNARIVAAGGHLHGGA